MATTYQTYQLSTKYNTTTQFQFSVENLDKSGYQNLGDYSDYFSKTLWTDTTTYINAQGGNDQIILKGPGNSVAYGGSGADYMSGGYGMDKFYGGSGSDQLFGGAGNDYLDGGTDNDYVDGGVGNDVLNGGAGNDLLQGGAGIDILTGGTGADTLIFSGGGLDYVKDFKVGDDKMVLYDFNGSSWETISFSSGKIWIEQKEDGQHVHVDNQLFADQVIVVQTTDGSLLTAADFI